GRGRGLVAVQHAAAADGDPGVDASSGLGTLLAGRRGGRRDERAPRLTEERLVADFAVLEGAVAVRVDTGADLLSAGRTFLARRGNDRDQRGRLRARTSVAIAVGRAIARGEQHGRPKPNPERSSNPTSRSGSHDTPASMGVRAAVLRARAKAEIRPRGPGARARPRSASVRAATRPTATRL